MRNDETAVKRHARCHGTQDNTPLFGTCPLCADNAHYVKLSSRMPLPRPARLLALVSLACQPLAARRATRDCATEILDELAGEDRAEVREILEPFAQRLPDPARRRPLRRLPAPPPGPRAPPGGPPWLSGESSRGQRRRAARPPVMQEPAAPGPHGLDGVRRGA